MRWTSVRGRKTDLIDSFPVATRERFHDGHCDKLSIGREGRAARLKGRWTNRRRFTGVEVNKHRREKKISRRWHKVCNSFSIGSPRRKELFSRRVRERANRPIRQTERIKVKASFPIRNKGDRFS